MQLVLEQGRPQLSLIHFWPGDAIRIESLEPIAVQKWTHLAVTYEGSSLASGLRIFVNGSPCKTQTLRDQLTRDFRYRGEWGDSNAGSVQFSLGARFRDVGFRDGAMDDLRIFTSELSDWDIAQIYLLSKRLRSDVQLFSTTFPKRRVCLRTLKLNAKRQTITTHRCVTL